MYEGTSRVGASITAPMSRGSLVISSLVALFFLGETATLPHVFGIVILLFGIAFVSHEIRKENSSFLSKGLLDFLLPVGTMFFLAYTLLLQKLGILKKHLYS